MRSVALPDGEMTSSWKETIKAIVQKYVPKDNPQGESEIHTNLRISNDQYLNCNQEPHITVEEIDAAIRKAKP